MMELAHEKWFRKTTAARSKWVDMIKKAESLDAFVKGIAAITGLSEAEVRASVPVSNWAEFQKNVDEYVDKFIAKVKKAYETKKWITKYKAAFSQTK